MKPSGPSNREEHRNNIFDILRKDANEVLDLINEVFENEINQKMKRRIILGIIKQLRKGEEYQKITDSEYLNIIEESYKLDPSFFMSSLYPKLVSWDYPSYSTVKEEVITLIDRLNKEFVPPNQELDDKSITFIKE